MIYAHHKPRARYLALTAFALLLSLGAALLYNTQTSRAITVIDAANATISADTAADAYVPQWTGLGVITFQTQIALYGSNAYVRLTAPTGWEFDQAGNPAITVPPVTDCVFQPEVMSAGTITFNLAGGTCSPDILQISNVRLRPISGGTTVSGNLTVSTNDGDGGGESATNVGLLTITPGGVDGFEFSEISDHDAGETFSVTITAVDQFGNTVTDFTNSVDLYAEESTFPWEEVEISAGGGNVGPFIAGQLTTNVLFNNPQETIILYVEWSEFWGESNEFSIIASSLETVTVLTATPAITVYGEVVTMTATVVSGSVPASGTVLFGASGVGLFGTAELNSSGVATFTYSSMAIGTYQLMAEYVGEGDYIGSFSEPVLHTVVQGSSTTVLSAPSTVPPGATFTMSATVSPVAPAAGMATGLVSFYDGATLLATSPLVNGVATVDVSLLAHGSHFLTAVYAGDTNFGPSTSAIHTIVVDPTASQITLTATGTPTAGQTITLDASVFPTAATGTVTFMDGSAVLGVVTVVNGAASFDATNLGVGVHPLSAHYSGDATHGSSSSNVVVVIVEEAEDPDPTPVVPDPTAVPTSSPTAAPSASPTAVPSASPTAVPTNPATPTVPSNMTSGSSAVGDMTFGTTTLTGFAIGDTIMINPGGANQESVVITGFGPLTFSTALLNAHFAGERLMLSAASVDEPASPTPLPPSTGTGPLDQGNVGTLLLIAGVVVLGFAVGGPLALRKKS